MELLCANRSQPQWQGLHRNERQRTRAGTEIKVTTERKDVSLSLTELDKGSWVIFDLPGFTTAASGTQQTSLDALRGSSDTSYFKDKGELWVKVVSSGDPGNGAPGGGTSVTVSRDAAAVAAARQASCPSCVRKSPRSGRGLFYSERSRESPFPVSQVPADNAFNLRCRRLQQAVAFRPTSSPTWPDFVRVAIRPRETARIGDPKGAVFPIVSYPRLALASARDVVHQEPLVADTHRDQRETDQGVPYSDASARNRTSVWFHR